MGETDRVCSGEAKAVPLECIIGSCHAHDAKASGGPEGESAEEKRERLSQLGAYTIPAGDIFTLGKLLDIAGVSLDGSRNKDGHPLRLAGTVLVVDVIYSNLHPVTSSFGDKTVSYHYSIYQRPVSEMKMEAVSSGWGIGDERTIHDLHGVLIAVSVRGHLGVFNVMNLLILLSTMAGCLTAVDFFTAQISMIIRKNEVIEEIADDPELSRKQESVEWPALLDRHGRLDKQGSMQCVSAYE